MATPKLKPEIRQIVEWAERHQWTLTGKKDGNGHWALRHKSGEIVRLPDTPGEYRGLINAKAKIRRISGLPNDSGPAARYRHESRRRDRFDMEAACEELRQREAERAESPDRPPVDPDEIKTELAILRTVLESLNPRRHQIQARKLAHRILALERELNFL
jgi:hypothetical protein